MTAATQTHPAHLDYVLRIADTALILGQRLSEWCGHGPVIEEDIALTNIALDLIGQARLLLTHAGALEGQGRDEDQLAFLRREPEFRNVTMAELPNGDFGRTILRNFLVAAWQRELWQALAKSSDTGTGGDRREEPEGNALSPAARVRLGDPARRRHRGVASPHAGRARHAVAVHRRVLQRDADGRRRRGHVGRVRRGRRCSPRGPRR